MNPELIETLRQAQRLGFFGSRDITDAARHSQAFVDALAPVADGSRLIDLGSGGGLPGLVVADAFPQASILLLDRRQKRTDFLERAVLRHGWSHVAVRCLDVAALIDEVSRGDVAPFDAVMARGFGPPELTLRSAVAVSGANGRIVISEPPSGHRWPDTLLEELGVTSRRLGAVRRFERASP